MIEPIGSMVVIIGCIFYDWPNRKYAKFLLDCRKYEKAILYALDALILMDEFLLTKNSRTDCPVLAERTGKAKPFLDTLHLAVKDLLKTYR